MTVIAFTYSNYDCSYPFNSFRGQYKDIEEATSLLKGNRYENHNLQTMDIDTLGWDTFEWQSLYEYRDCYIGDKHHEYLKHRWDDSKPEFEIKWEEYREYGEHQIYYDAGEWNHDI